MKIIFLDFLFFCMHNSCAAVEVVENIGDDYTADDADLIIISNGTESPVDPIIIDVLNIPTLIQTLASTLEFSKDISSLLTEATLKSKCDGFLFITSEDCRDFLDYTLEQMSGWAPPAIVITYKDYNKIVNPDLWMTFLAWKKRPCSIVFVCDIATKFSNTTSDQKTEIGHLKLPKFIESSDQVIYLSDYMNSMVSDSSMIQMQILKRSGVLLEILMENQMHEEEEPEALMHVYSVCEYCSRQTSNRQITDLGYWQRNKTRFGKFFHVFTDFHRQSFNNTNLKVGYFNHPPHFSCHSSYPNERSKEDEECDGDDYDCDCVDACQDDFGDHQMDGVFCEGVEWEMLRQMSQSLEFSTSLVNLSNPDFGYPTSQEVYEADEPSNITNIMISAFKDERIDLAVGGISVTPKRIMHLDFSSVFANDPVVFVVRKKSDLFAFGIWLAINPEIWPLILLLIGIISLLFHIIIYQYTLETPKYKKAKERWKYAMSAYLFDDPNRKPIHVVMFEALEITLQPLLGQPLSASQITHRPRRLLKFLLIIWWFSCLTISTLYNTSLITSLINPITPKEPEALQDLLDFGYKFKAAGKQGAFFELIKSVQDRVSGALGNNDNANVGLEAGGPGENPTLDKKTASLLKQLSERLIVTTKKKEKATKKTTAYVIEESAVKGTDWENKVNGQIMVIRERLFLKTYAWPTQRHAPFKKKIDSALGRLNDAGLVDYWYHHHQSEHDEHHSHRPQHHEKDQRSRLREKLSQITLNMQVLQGAFIFLLFGNVVGGMVLGVEHLTKRYKFRFWTRKELRKKFGKVSTALNKIYGKYFASEHVDLELRRKKKVNGKTRFRGAVRTVATFSKKHIIQVQHDNNTAEKRKIPFLK